MTRMMKDSGIPYIGMMPEEWQLLRGKYVLTKLQRPVKIDDGIVTCFRDGEVTLRSNRREDGFTMSDKEIGYQGVDIGDLVVHGMDGFAGAIGISDSRGKASPVLNVLDSVHDKRFLKYFLRSLAYGDVFTAWSTGIRVRSCDLGWNKLSELKLIIPTIPEQHRIADYLDEKCTSIDAAIEAGEKEIEKLKAYKQSVIINAVTKGLNPDVEMKDSGIEWIGEYPRKWKLMPVKYLVTIRNGSDPILEGNIPVYGSGTSSFKSCGEYKMGPAVLLGRKGSISIPNYVEGKYWNVDTAFDAKTKDHRLNLKFYYYCAVCFDYESYITQTTIPSMTQTDYGNMRIPFPERDEQEMIVKYLDQKVSEISGMIKIKQDQVEKLNAYKKSVIYTYVTGKKEVPNG